MNYCANCERPFESFGGMYEWTHDFCSIGCYEDSHNKDND